MYNFFNNNFFLGLEPSDDENSSDDSFPEFNTTDSLTTTSQSTNRLELYLLKKQLRLESSRLVKRAKIAVPVVQTAKHFKNCVGAAFRARDANRRREALTGVEQPRLRTCLYVKQLETETERLNANGQRMQRCLNICLPNSNHCAEHMLYNVNQKLFGYCQRRCCGRPVLCVESVHTEGLCRKHFVENESVDQILTTTNKQQQFVVQQQQRKTTTNPPQQYTTRQQQQIVVVNGVRSGDVNDCGVETGTKIIAATAPLMTTTMPPANATTNLFYDDINMNAGVDNINDADGLFYFINKKRSLNLILDKIFNNFN